MKIQLPLLFGWCHFNCLITVLLGLFFLFFINLIQTWFWGGVTVRSDWERTEVRFHTSLSVFCLWMVEHCGRHIDTFLLFLPFPQHLHHTAKIRILFFWSIFLTNRVQHYGCLLEGSWSGLTLFPFVQYHVPCSPSKYFSLSNNDDEAAPQREINGH